MNQVFDGELKAGVIDYATAANTAQHFFSAVVKGFGADFSAIDYTSPDYGLLRNLERNCYQFAGAKNYQTLRQLNDLLRDGDRVRGRNEFKREARKMLDEWNGNWQDTEYNTALNSAINARKWQEFESRKDIMPLLQFKIVKDERTCPICKPFSDMVRPMSDPVWDYATPALHFGDRCTILQLPDTSLPLTDTVPPPDAIPKMFRVNLAKEQLAFPPSHPYYIGVKDKALAGFVNSNTKSQLPNYTFDKAVRSRIKEDIDLGTVGTTYGINTNDIINLCGGIPTKDFEWMNIRVRAYSGHLIYAHIESDLYKVDRQINFKSKDIYNALMKAHKRGDGIGTSLFVNQVQAAKNLGFKQLGVTAAGSGGDGDWTGYYRWARLGYILDSEYKSKFLRWAELHNRKEKTLNALVAKEEGYKYWKDNGFGWGGVFNLHENSRNMQYLRRYLEKKGIDFML